MSLTPQERDLINRAFALLDTITENQRKISDQLINLEEKFKYIDLQEKPLNYESAAMHSGFSISTIKKYKNQIGIPFTKSKLDNFFNNFKSYPRKNHVTSNQ